MSSTLDFDANVIFHLGALYNVNVNLLITEEELSDELDDEIIERAMDMILCDIGIDIKKICSELKISPYKREWVTVKRKNINESDFEIIHCKGCNKKMSVLKISPKNICSECVEELLKK